jgi:hypothetical protein
MMAAPPTDGQLQTQAGVWLDAVTFELPSVAQQWRTEALAGQVLPYPVVVSGWR